MQKPNIVFKYIYTYGRQKVQELTYYNEHLLAKPITHSPLR